MYRIVTTDVTSTEETTGETAAETPADATMTGHVKMTGRVTMTGVVTTGIPGDATGERSKLHRNFDLRIRQVT